MSEWEAVVVDLDGGESLERCLRSIESQTAPPVRIIVVDNGSSVPVAERLGDRRLPVHLLRDDHNLGFTGGVNVGWRESTAPLIALINNDVELRPEWAESLIERLKEDDHLAAVQSVIVSPEGLVDGAGIEVVGGRFLQLGHGDELTALEREPWGVSATAALYRRDALEDVAVRGRLLHPAFFAYYEDVELSARLRDSGWRLSLVQRPLVVHEGSRTAPRLGYRADYLRTRNRYFVRRLHHRVSSYPALVLEDVGKIIRALFRFELKRAVVIAAGVVGGILGWI